MPPKKTTTTTATAPSAAKKSAPLSAAAMKSLPAPTHHIGANYTFAWTKAYTEAKEHRIDLVVFLNGSVHEHESPSIRIENSITLHIYPQYNKTLLSSNIPSLLGWDENSACSEAFASIGQDLANSQQFKSDANRRIITGAPQIIQLPEDGTSVKETEPEVTIHPYENGNKIRQYKQYNSILIARLKIDKPWKEVNAGIKAGAVINLLGFSQSSEESPPRGHPKRGGGGGGGGYGGGKGEGRKRSKLNSVEEDDGEEDQD